MQLTRIALRVAALGALVALLGCATGTPPAAPSGPDPVIPVSEAPPAEPDPDPMTRADTCGPMPEQLAWPILADIVSIAADGEGALVVVQRGRRSRVALCHRASMCSGAAHGVVVGVSEQRAELRMAAPPAALAGCPHAIISRDPESAPDP